MATKPDGDRRTASAAWLNGLCSELGIGRLRTAAIERRALAALSACPDGAAMGRVLARCLCEDGRHGAEAEVGRRLVADAGAEDAGSAAAAWLVVVGALMHLALRDPARVDALLQVRSEACTAVAEVRSIAGSALSPGTQRRLLDPIAAILLEVERTLGVPPSPDACDLVRRREARAVPLPRGRGFLDRHGAGVAALAAREARAWWRDRFMERFGSEPPDGWWTNDGAGGWVASRAREEGWFDESDERAFADDMEARYRAEMGLPARGEGWVSGPHLASCIEAALPGVDVVREARVPWLGRQRLDVYVPALGVAFEYQGEQHYLPLPHWGGEAGLAARRELDERKRDACVRAGIRLVEWRYDEPVSVDAARRRLERIGVVPVA